MSFHGGQYRCEWQIDLIENCDQVLGFHLLTEQRSQPLQEVGVLAGSAGESQIQVAEYDLGEVMLRRGGPQQIGIEHDGVARASEGPFQQFDQLGGSSISLGSCTIFGRLGSDRNARSGAIISPWESHQAERPTPGPGDNSKPATRAP